MLCSDLKVVGLTITEDFYEYKGIFDLCCDEMCFRLDLSELTDEKLMEIKKMFDLEELLDEIRSAIMSKVYYAADTECGNVTGSPE